MPEPQSTSTRLKRPSQPLWNGHSYAHAIVETVREPLLVLDKDLRVKSANRSFYETFHVSPQETQDRLIYEMGDRRWDIPKLREFLEEILPQDAQFQDFEVEHDFPTIGRKTVLLNARRLRQEGTDAELILLAVEDITERKQAEEALRESEGRFRTLYESSLDGIAAADLDGYITECNQAYAEMLGYTREELRGIRFQDITPSKWHALNAEFVSRVMDQGCPDVFEKEYIRKDGTVFPVSLRTWKIEDKAGNPVGVWSIVRDITERKRAEEEMTALKDALEKRVAELDAFADSVSHDLKEPLRAIEAFGRFVLEDCGDRLDERGREYLERLAAASVRMQRLIDDLLALSRASRHSRPSRVNVGRLVREVAEWMRPQIEGQSATVEVEGGLPEVAADSTQVEQIFRNLIGNGLKFNQSGRPLVRVGFKGKEGRMGIFYVQDNGIGIEPQYHERIFGMFQRLHRREEYDGTGAGLAIVKRVVEYLSGRIWIESEVGAGSTFFVALPLCTKEAASRLREAA
ncbi:MAG: PAS domain S-box protein [Dehalococcoidia bacterium]|nr:PAS domain S-box protein [Dehalococcoidia bacterium]